jgi:hypothetical protein
MKITTGSKRYYYAARLGIFLVVAALIAGVGGCQGGGLQHKLTITSTAGGNVTEPGEGTFMYDEGAVVNLVAEAEGGYGFVRWTCGCGAGIIADIGAATTSIVMSGNYSITACFGEIIEVRDWSDLNASRDSPDGYYLLMNDLDSTTPGYAELAGPSANGGKGWQPIGTNDAHFTGALEGQGHQIRDLYIDRPDENDVGLFGANSGAIRDVGVVNASVIGQALVGGLAGWNAGAVSDCYFTGNVTGAETWNGVGGLVGSSQGILKASYSAGSVTGNRNVGGLLGEQYAEGVVTACYSTSNVVGANGVGGLVGMIQWSAITDSYSTGGVAGDLYVGGLVGETMADTATTVDQCFWDIDTYGQTTSAAGTGKSTAEMQDIATFSGAGWNITAVADPGARNAAYIWNIVDGVTYPFLSWQGA